MRFVDFKKVIDFDGVLKSIITRSYSPFSVLSFGSGVRIEYKGFVIAQRHIHMNLDDREKEYEVALDSAYRQAALWVFLNRSHEMRNLYRHVYRTKNDELSEPEVFNDPTVFLHEIMQMTKLANDVVAYIKHIPGPSTQLESEFDVVLRHDGDIFTSTGTNYQITNLSRLTELPILGQ